MKGLMKKARFKVWLSGKRELNARSVGSRISNCRRVEHYEGDLDTHYDADGLASLMDCLSPRGPKHRIPINGDIYNGTATLKNAVGLYRDFCRTVGSPGAPAKRRTQERQTRRPGAHWPVWPQPNDEDLLELARAMAPLVRFLDPAIVGAVANTSVPHFQDHASDNWEPEGAGSDGVVNRSWSGRRSNMLSWSTCSIW